MFFAGKYSWRLSNLLEIEHRHDLTLYRNKIVWNNKSTTQWETTTLWEQAIRVQDIDTRWGIINGRLIDSFDNTLDSAELLSQTGGAVAGGVVGGVAGVGIDLGAPLSLNPGRPGDIRNLLPCRQSACSLQQIFPPRCEYIPVLRSSLTGAYCLGCPEDICRGSNLDITGDVGVGIGGILAGSGGLTGGAGGVLGGAGGREGAAGRRRRGDRRRSRRQRRRMRRIQRQACRLLGICDFPGIGGQGLGRRPGVSVGNIIGAADLTDVAVSGGGLFTGTGAGVLGTGGVGVLPGSGVGVLPGTGVGVLPGSGVGLLPGSGVGVLPGSGVGVFPGGGGGVLPGTGVGILGDSGVGVIGQSGLGVRGDAGVGLKY